MRLWHKDLIPVLPKNQLIGQWRELCLIAKNINEKGTPNHLLVNKIMNYPLSHLWKYGFLVMCEMDNRHYKCDFRKFEKYFDKPYALATPSYEELFHNWHNNIYYIQCFFNLQEKHDCGGISDEDWIKIINKYLVSFH